MPLQTLKQPPKTDISTQSGRSWPTPSHPWIMRMQWHDLLFAHWPVDPERIIPHLPPGLTLDLWQGQAWLGVVPFGMKGVGPRALPSIPTTGAFLECNVRTYVTAHDKPGVFFFSLDAASKNLFHASPREPKRSSPIPLHLTITHIFSTPSKPPQNTPAVLSSGPSELARW